MRALHLLALLALGSPFHALADSDIYQPPDRPGTVTIYRGGNASVASPVTVHRGSAIRPGYLTAQAQPPMTETVGGRRIWFVDRAQGGLTSCRVINTLTVGRQRIRCTRASLPD